MSRFLGLLTLALVVLATLAFWPQYLSKSFAGIDGYTHAHAVLGTAWLLVLIAQPLLIRRGFRSAHRIVGRVALVVAAAFVVSGVLLAHFKLGRLSEEAFAEEGIYVYLPLSVALLFGLACALGYGFRQSVAVHARFMASTALLLIDPVVSRVLYFYFPPLPSLDLYQGSTFVVIAIALTLLVRSLPPAAKGRNGYRNYCLAAGAILALYFVVPYTRPWLAFVEWFRAVPLT
jgi:uncharacterized membrane protein YozB (DUF420 family)